MNGMHPSSSRAALLIASLSWSLCWAAFAPVAAAHPDPPPRRPPAEDSDREVLENDTSGSSADGAAARKSSRGTRTTLRRGPYLQRASPTSIIIAWRTAGLTSSRVSYGTSPQSLEQTVILPKPVGEHRVTLEGLAPNTRYYYAIGSAEGILFGDETTYFHTSPPTGSTQPLRLWVIGDSGMGDINADIVYKGFLSWNAGRRVDGWLMLGDNAYPLGTDYEYQVAVFETYPELLRQVPLWPIYGNHDGQSANANSQSGVYFDIFDPPTQGEAGGVPSGNEAYYSFDVGNVHIVVLSSYQTPRSPGSAMAAWLDADLAAAAADWLIVAFHHPPYSKGSHDSDTEAEMVEMRQNLLPILEARGVDLVLTGHSHGYERSMLLDGHYGLSTGFGATMIKDPGDGRIDGDGPYLKPAGNLPHEGTLYAVIGISSSYSLGGSLNHPVMLVNRRQMGSMVLDIEGGRLDAKVVDPLGGLIDHFTMAKGADPCPQSDLVAPGAIWKYRDDGVDLGVSWRLPGYADGTWPAGAAELGYGDGDEATVIGYGPNPSAKYPTSYFRHGFTVGDPASARALEVAVRRDDAVAIYLNGVPVAADNFASHTILYGTWAASAIGGAAESQWLTYQLDPSLLRAGANVIAAEVHQASPSSTDLSFDLALRARFCR